MVMFPAVKFTDVGRRILLADNSVEKYPAASFFSPSRCSSTIIDLPCVFHIESINPGNCLTRAMKEGWRDDCLAQSIVALWTVSRNKHDKHLSTFLDSCRSFPHSAFHSWLPRSTRVLLVVVPPICPHDLESAYPTISMMMKSLTRGLGR
jgi:hypothetical protein